MHANSTPWLWRRQKLCTAEVGKSHQKKLTTQMSSSSTGNTKGQSTFMASFSTKKVPSPGPSSSRRSSHASQPVALTSATPSQSRVLSEREPINVDSIPDNSARRLLHSLSLHKPSGSVCSTYIVVLCSAARRHKPTNSSAYLSSTSPLPPPHSTPHYALLVLTSH